MKQNKIEISSLKITVLLTTFMSCLSFIMIFVPDVMMSILTSISVFGSSPDPMLSVKNFRFLGMVGVIVFGIGTVANISKYYIILNKEKRNDAGYSSQEEC
jgi:hypothetical protein